MVGRLFVAPGNGGTTVDNVPIAATDIANLKEFAQVNSCFTVVGPEAPLALGIADEFVRSDLPIFAPTAEQAMLETSKAFAKDFMKAHGIPTADFQIFDDVNRALDYATRKNGEVVVKADGLASGKGVFVCSSVDEAARAIRLVLEKKAFGSSGDKIVVEDKIQGREASYMFICDGKNAQSFSDGVDHKRALDGDKGPNTGGMGAFSPAPKLPSDIQQSLKENIVNPVLDYTGFRGFLFVGLMFDERNRPFVLEFNARLGDPEAQAILPRLDSGLLEIMQPCVQNRGGLSEIPGLKWSKDKSCTVVMCSEGYPEQPRVGDQIFGLDKATSQKDVLVFHSGTVQKSNGYYTNGGRVLAVTGLGESIGEARNRAYEAVRFISWRGERHRTDISATAV